MSDYRPSTCASAASVCGSQKSSPSCTSRSPSTTQYGPAPAGRCAYSVPRPRWQCAWSGRMPSSSPGRGLAGSGLRPVDCEGWRWSDLAQEPQRLGLVATFLVGPGECQRPLREGPGLFQAARQEIGLALQQWRVPWVRGSCLLHHLREHGRASATRPANAYATPKRPAIPCKKRAMSRPDSWRRPVRGWGWRAGDHPGGGPAYRAHWAKIGLLR